MLIKFKSPASGPFITTQSVADELLKAIGKNATANGIIAKSEIEKMIDILELRIKEEKKETCFREKTKIGFPQRAFPLLEMLKKAKLENEFVIWDKL